MTPHRHPDPINSAARCACGKLTLPSMKAARLAVKAQRVKGYVMRIYRCDEADEIHLTQRPTWESDPRHIRPPRGETKGL